MLVPAEVQRIANKYKYSARDINPKDRGHLLKYEIVGDSGSSDNKVLVKNSIAYDVAFSDVRVFKDLPVRLDIFFTTGTVVVYFGNSKGKFPRGPTHKGVSLGYLEGIFMDPRNPIEVPQSKVESPIVVEKKYTIKEAHPVYEFTGRNECLPKKLKTEADEPSTISREKVVTVKNKVPSHEKRPTETKNFKNFTEMMNGREINLFTTSAKGMHDISGQELNFNDSFDDVEDKYSCDDSEDNNDYPSDEDLHDDNLIPVHFINQMWPVYPLGRDEALSWFMKTRRQSILKDHGVDIKNVEGNEREIRVQSNNARFQCPDCRRKWSSFKVWVVFEMKYMEVKYINGQKCQDCLGDFISPSKFFYDSDYNGTSWKQIVNRAIDKMVDMMSGSYYTRPRVTSSHDGPPHRSDLCEGCKRGTCRF